MPVRMQHTNERPVARNKAKGGRLSLRIRLKKRPGQRCSLIKNVQGPELHFQHWKIEKGEEEQRSGAEGKGGEGKKKTHKRVTKTFWLSYGKDRVNMGEK